MAITTLNAHIDSAIQLQKRIDNAYIVIGKTSAWNDETNPTDEIKDVDTLDEVIGYKKLEKLSLARPIAEGETKDNLTYPVVVYGEEEWVLIPVSEAFTEKARWLYAETGIHPDELPLGMYRQVGVHFGVEANNGVTKLSLIPSEVKNVGTLYMYANREPHNRTDNTYVVEQFIIKV